MRRLPRPRGLVMGRPFRVAWRERLRVWRGSREARTRILVRIAWGLGLLTWVVLCCRVSGWAHPG